VLQLPIIRLTACYLPVVCGVGAITCTRNAPKRATVSWWTEQNLIPQTIEAAGTPRNRCQRESRRERPKTTTGRWFSSSHTTPGLPFAAVLRSNTQQQQQPQLPSVAQVCTPSLGVQPTTSTKSVSSGSVSERHVHCSRNGISAAHDRAQRGRVTKRQNSGHHKNCIKTHEENGR
jgi:hypothetical protein